MAERPSPKVRTILPNGIARGKDSLESTKKAVIRAIDDMVELRDEEIKRLREKNIELSSEINSKAQEMSNMEKNFVALTACLQSVNVSKEQEIENLKRKKEEIAADLKESRREGQIHQGIVQEQKEEINTKENRLRNEEYKNTRLTDEKAKLETTISSLEGKIKTMEGEMAVNMRRHSQEIEKQRREKEQEIRTLEGKLLSVTRHMKELEKNIAQLKATLNDLKLKKDNQADYEALKKRFEMQAELMIADRGYAKKSIKEAEEKIKCLEMELEEKSRDCESAVKAGIEKRNIADKQLQRAERYKMETQKLQQTEARLTNEVEAKEEILRKAMQQKDDQLMSMENDMQIQRTKYRELQQHCEEVKQEIPTLLHVAFDKEIKALLAQRRKPKLDLDLRTLQNFAITPKTISYPKTTVELGAFGLVHQVIIDGKPMVAKVIQPILMGKGRYPRVSENNKQVFHERFKRECLLLEKASRSGNENIVKFCGVIIGRGRHNLTLLMEKLDINLYHYLDQRHPKPLATKLSILHDVSCGLVHLHETCSIVHKDLTLGNVLLTLQKRAKIADLGLSNIYDEPRYTTTFGQPNYMPSKVKKNQEPVDKSLDVFSFGCVMLYVAMEKFIPIEDPPGDYNELQRRGVIIAEMDHKQSEFSNLVRWCLADESHERPCSTTLQVVLDVMKSTYFTVI